jgi:hypothetical protein
MKALRFGPTAGAATPAVVAAALPRSGGAEQRWADGETSPPWRTLQRSRARPERMTLIELAAVRTSFSAFAMRTGGEHIDSNPAPRTPSRGQNPHVGRAVLMAGQAHI